MTQLVTSLWRSASESGREGSAGEEPVAQLGPFLGERGAAFWHELRWGLLFVGSAFVLNFVLSFCVICFEFPAG